MLFVADGATSISEIKANICKYYRFITTPLNEIKNIVDSLIERNLLVVHDVKKELHKHVSFNKSLLKQIDIKVKRRTILSIADMELSITDLCPFNCSYCSKKENKSTKDYVTIEEWKKVIKEAYLMGANGIKLTGGEPLHPLVIDKTLSIAKYAREIGYERVVLLTSGYSLADNIQRVVEAGITEISISYNMINKIEEDKIRNKYVEENFDKFLVLQEYNIKLNICCVVNQESIKLVDKVLQYAIEKGIGCIHYYPVMPVGNARDSWDTNKLNVEELKNTMQRLQKKSVELQDRISISAEQMFMSFYDDIELGCEALNYWVYIAEDGRVSACACADMSNYNIKNTSFIKIWRESDYFENLRSYVDSTSCKKCNDRKYCTCNCYIRLLQAQNGLHYSYDRCKYNEY